MNRARKSWCTQCNEDGLVTIKQLLGFDGDCRLKSWQGIVRKQMPQAVYDQISSRANHLEAYAAD
jgi:hypothetical protein